MHLADVKPKLLRTNFWVKFSKATFHYIAWPNLFIAESQSVTQGKCSSIVAGLQTSKDSAAGREALLWALEIARGLLPIHLYSSSPQTLSYIIVLAQFLSLCVLKRPRRALACRLASWPLRNGACGTRVVPLLPSALAQAQSFSSEQPSLLLKLHCELDFHIFLSNLAKIIPWV